jgi:hypothetical protein
MVFSLLFIFPLVGLLIWFFLKAREDKRAANGLPRHSGLRLMFASIAGVIILFSGGCGTVIGIGEFMRPRSGSADDFMSWELVAVFSLPPLLIGLLIWWLAMRRSS